MFVAVQTDRRTRHRRGSRISETESARRKGAMLPRKNSKNWKSLVRFQAFLLSTYKRRVWEALGLNTQHRRHLNRRKRGGKLSMKIIVGTQKVEGTNLLDPTLDPRLRHRLAHRSLCPIVCISVCAFDLIDDHIRPNR